MYFAGSQMHMVTFCIIVFELVMLIFQGIYFLQRPNDRSRLLYFILLVFLLLYNITGGFFPDEKIPIPIIVQEIIAYSLGFGMSMYVVFYFYKVFDLRHLKFFVTYGLIFCLLIPFVFLFVIPLILTGNLDLSRQLTVIIPFVYGICFVVSTTRALYKKFRESKFEGVETEDPLYHHAIAAYISMVCWAALPVIVFFGDFQVLGHSVTNAGFLMMTIIYIRSSIMQARKEYEKLIISEKNLQELNHRLQEKVKERTKRLEELYEQRSNTFINLAHETKTPLTLINNYLQEYVEKYGMNSEMQIIKANIQRLTSDIVNFFDSERFNRGFEVYDHNQITNFSFILNLKITLFKSLASKKEINIKEHVEQNVYIKAHPGAIERIVNNLIENAIKYSPNGSEIEIRLNTENGNIVFCVSDNGIGIPLDYQKKIFEPYFQLIHNSNKSYEGMGMGLSIVSKVVHDLHGKIVLSSKENEGTTIEVMLNQHFLKEGENVNSYESQPTVNHINLYREIKDEIPDLNRPFILIVEDNIAMLSYLVHKMKVKYNVYAARNGSEALHKIGNIKRLDLIISDVMMEDVNGFELLRSLSKMSKWAHVPLILLTAKTTIEDKVKGLRLGAIDFIEKPFFIEHLYSKVEAVLANIEKQQLALVKKATHLVYSDREVAVLQQQIETPFERNSRKYSLTAREVEIITLLSQGHPYKIIADKLNISNKTVAAHLSNIFEKLDVNNKVELINKMNSTE
jgi:signal transduction histidine kinase/DNA-binding NarL/FixJ family response regulator